jgi:hypothetical protein
VNLSIFAVRQDFLDSAGYCKMRVFVSWRFIGIDWDIAGTFLVTDETGSRGEPIGKGDCLQ